MTMIVLAMSARAAAPLPEAPGLLPTAVVRPVLDRDPSVAAARAGLEAARQEAGILDKSPYEWTAKLSSQRRTLQTGPRYQEWNAALEHSLRLPGKATADRSLGKATVEEAEARYGEALLEAAKELLTAWLDWVGAERGYELTQKNRQSALENLAVVEKRMRAGDASKLEVSLAAAELAEQRRADNDAKTQAAVAWARLHARFPGIERQFGTMPTPMPLKQPPSFWRDRILAESDELKIVEAQLRKSQAHAERARADKVPDPTIGLYTASEVGGQERITGIMISIPFPGGQRDRRAAKAIHTAEFTRQELELKKRQLDAEIGSGLATVEGSYESLQIAEAGASAMQNNAALMQKAYSLGESDLQGLLSARRQATTAAQNALAARIAATKAYYVLLVDAHLVWDLGHE